MLRKIAKQVTSSSSVSPVEDAVVVKYVNIGLSNGMKMEHHNLSYFEQALTYMTKHWEELIAYVKIGSVQIDNNCW